jgi:hypothetical protein
MMIFMVRQTDGSISNFKTNSLSRLNDNHCLRSKLNQDLLSTNLYSSDNNSLSMYHQNIWGLQGKTNELISSLYSDLPH